MAMFHSYGDASGTQSSRDGKMLVTVGVVATDRRWERFDKKWASVMAEFGVTALHMKQFAHSVGDYSAWKGDNEKRVAFLARLIGLAKTGINKAFVTALSLQDYRATNSTHELEERVQSPYALAQVYCLGETYSWLQKAKKDGDQVMFFIEEGDSGQPAFLADAQRFLGWRPNPIPRIAPDGRPYTPLQVADLIAYEYNLAYQRLQDAGNTRPLRGSLKELLRMLPIQDGALDADFFARYVTANNIPRRQ